MIKKIINIKSLMAVLVLMSPFHTSRAAIIDVTSLTVNGISANISITGLPSTGGSSSIVPPAVIIMGSYQDPILSFNETFVGGSFDASIYTSAIGGAAPSATVDTVAGDFASINLESLRIDGMLSATGLGTYSFDTSFWPFNTSPNASMYDPVNGDFSLAWAFTDMVSVMHNGTTQDISIGFDVSLSGQASVVPVPAAIWLFVSGMLALIGFARSKH